MRCHGSVAVALGLVNIACRSEGEIVRPLAAIEPLPKPAGVAWTRRARYRGVCDNEQAASPRRSNV